jgi:hypothetical protein
LHVPGPMIGVDDRLVPALVTLDCERPHAILAHVYRVCNCKSASFTGAAPARLSPQQDG